MKQPMTEGTFFPREPRSLEDSGLSEADVEGLILRFLANRGDATGWTIASQVKLPLPVLASLLMRLKDTQLVGYAGSAPMNDFVYRITDRGRDRAFQGSATTYFEAAPVPLADYVASVRAQAPRLHSPTKDDLRRAFDGLLINERMLDRLGPAINAGQAMFLYGPSGNGKSSIAARLATAYPGELWIPRAILIGSTVVRLFDPTRHVELSSGAADGLGGPGGSTPGADARWVRIERPTIVTGGELTLDQLEVSVNPTTGVGEAPIQLKSNCGTLVVDDFGRQVVQVSELLNRWMIPLEQRHDFLHMPDGKIVEIPFEQFVVFSTNLEPRELVDEAFLRRIPYKIRAGNPTEEEFHELFRMVGAEMGVEYRRDGVASLLTRYYQAEGRDMRYCHPRDLLRHVINDAEYRRADPSMTEDALDMAAEGYFVI